LTWIRAVALPASLAIGRFVERVARVVLIALCTDIHGNREAFEACLAHVGPYGSIGYFPFSSSAA
jgi:hypothetical protein